MEGPGNFRTLQVLANGLTLYLPTHTNVHPYGRSFNFDLFADLLNFTSALKCILFSLLYATSTSSPGI